MAEPIGYIKIDRALFSHPALIERHPYSRVEAWLYLIRMANFADGHFFDANTKIEIKRGQLFTSQVKLAEEWGWDRGKVQRFLKCLEGEQMILQHTSNKSSTITITKYLEYQGDRDKSVQRVSTKKTSNVQQMSTYKEEEKKKEEQFSVEEFDAFSKFNLWMAENVPLVCKLPIQFSCRQFLDRKKKYGHTDMVEALTAMENWKPLLQNKTSAPLTMDKFIKTMLKDRELEAEKRKG